MGTFIAFYSVFACSIAAMIQIAAARAALASRYDLAAYNTSLATLLAVTVLLINM